MNVWLRFRQELYERYKIPADKEIHSVNFLSGRGQPSKEAKWNHSKQVRRAIFVDALQVISDLPGVSVGAVYRRGQRKHFGQVLRDVFCKLLLGLDRRLFLAGMQGVLIIDGGGSDPTYSHMWSQNLSDRHLTGGRASSRHTKASGSRSRTSWHTPHTKPW